jgi:hypothetical protein
MEILLTPRWKHADFAKFKALISMGGHFLALLISRLTGKGNAASLAAGNVILTGLRLN